ncbi:MAG TPA: toll/interleukin-1 receptor domain-containing protein [Acidimicrobiales bacterium]|nr:toll/interleukin-1 receptor domain-containing protein [Acidimicrobiales bacterium]
MAHDVFISYSSHDKPVGDAVCASLEAKGIRCWMAPRDILPGADWGNSIVEAITGARVMVLVFSRNANESPHIKREVERAVHRGLIIIPFRIEDVMPEDSLEYFLGTPHWLDAITPPLEDHLERLAEVVSSFLGRQPPTEPPEPVRGKHRRRAVGYVGVGAVALVVVIVVVALVAKGGGKGGGGHARTAIGTSTVLSHTSVSHASTTAPTLTTSTTAPAVTTSTTLPPVNTSTTLPSVSTSTTPPISVSTAQLTGSWEIEDPLDDMSTWSLDLQSDHSYTESFEFATNGSAKWGGTVVASKPFASSAGSLNVVLVATQGDENSVTFTPIGPGQLEALYLLPSGLANFLEETASYSPSTGIAGTVVNDHEWQASVMAGAKEWSLDFEANGPGYTFSAEHSESGTWSMANGEIQLVPKSGPETALTYSSVTSTTMLLSEPGVPPVTFVRAS